MLQARSGDGMQNAFTQLIHAQTEMMTRMLAPVAPGPDASSAEVEDAVQWADVAQRMQTLWLDFQAEQIKQVAAPNRALAGFDQLATLAQGWFRQMPLSDPEQQARLFGDVLTVWETVLGGFGPDGAFRAGSAAELPRTDPRFADPLWREQPFFALLHQTYLAVAEQLTQMAEAVEGLEPARKDQLRFATRAVLEAVNPGNFPLTNPVALERARQTRGESLVKGMENMLADLRRGQLTHTAPAAFKLGEDIAATPGKVVHETPLYQIIQYSPVTETVLELPVVIFPPWINRFYILDLSPKKSFVRWAVEQGITVFMVSWRSADETMADVQWSDYVAGQVAAVEFACERLGVPAAHTVGYCVAGTTLAATLAVLARRGEADKVASATFFTAQVDFANAGDLKHFAQDQTIDALGQLAPEGFVDGRYLAAAFNLLRSDDLIWNYVRKHYFLGEDYPAFDLLHWNGDVTNLPARWHVDYLRDCYRDNRMVIADSLSVCDVPLDLRRIATPCYIQAGRDDHIAPAESVWKLTRHLTGPWTFVLAGSGHIAGVINPPSAGKYQYWTNDGDPESLGDFIDGAIEHPGSWWPHWSAWLRGIDSREVPADGKRKPGGRGDHVIENAPGRYVATR